MEAQGTSRSPIVLFDDDCELCSRWVRFIVDRDTEGLFRFAGLGTDAAARVLANRPPVVADTVAVLTPEGILIRSDAVLYVLERLRGFAWIARALRRFPRAVRDGAYNLVARHRRQFLRARSGVCRIEVGPRDRFL